MINYLDVIKNILKDFCFCNSKMWIIVIWMRAWMDDSIHIQVQIIKFRNLRIMIYSNVIKIIILDGLNSSFCKSKPYFNQIHINFICSYTHISAFKNDYLNKVKIFLPYIKSLKKAIKNQVIKKFWKINFANNSANYVI